LEDLRLSYIARSVERVQILDVGAIFFARRQNKRIDVPQVENAILAKLPDQLLPPNESDASIIEASSGSEITDAEDGDLRMGWREGEARHLFSMRYDDWVGKQGPLTTEQKRAVSHQVKKPLRIHGPAGSGKTLVLILKALGFLRKAQDSEARCHVLVVLHSNAMRATVQAAIDAIDDRSFLAGNRDDPQFLDIVTLHGWCMRELGLDEGPKYVLEADPEESRRIQREVLELALDETIRTEYKQYRAILSEDLRKWIEGDRNRLLRSVQWEVAIRIKGRGFRLGDREQYSRDPLKSFIGRGENRYDRQLLFRIFANYQSHFEKEGLLDTDDVVLSMASRLSTPLWQVQRKHLGYDYVLVDETHLFNENERRVLPMLCRNASALLPIVMTFDEAQSIGGKRTQDLENVGIENSEKRTLSSVHRSCPEIFALARDIVERGVLVFSEFETAEPRSAMVGKQAKECATPEVHFCIDAEAVFVEVLRLVAQLRRHLRRVAVISFDIEIIRRLIASPDGEGDRFTHIRERGELAGAVPQPGVFVMTPEACGGLEFDAVVICGADEGNVPPEHEDLSAQAALFLEEEAYREMYTAVTRARYRLHVVTDKTRGLTSILRVSLSAGLIREAPKAAKAKHKL
jgi:superfamily I DNA/RNA helicase